MKKSMFFVVISGIFLLMFSGCSMMPDDEEIIRGSILENEILSNEDIDNENLIVDDENGDENGDENIGNDGLITNNDDGDESAVNDDENSEVLFEVVN